MRLTLRFAVLIFISYLLPSSVSAQDETLGRLFHDPAAREALEAKRGMPTKIKPKPKASMRQQKTAPVKSIALPDPIMLGGYVKRHDGKNTVWINQKPVSENTSTDSVNIGRIVKQHQSKQNSLLAKQNRLNKIDQLVIKVPANNKVITLKPGQRYIPEDNRVDDVTYLPIE